MDLPPLVVERLIRGALALQRASNTIARDAGGVLRTLFDELVAELVKIDPTGPSAERYRRMRVEKVLERDEELSGGAFRDRNKRIRQDLAYLCRAQGEDRKSTRL